MDENITTMRSFILSLTYNTLHCMPRADITSQHIVPLGYLLTLITLFMFIVFDRVAYTIGSPLAKSILHVSEMIVYFWYCSSLIWNSDASRSYFFTKDLSTAPLGHIRAVLLLKCLSFAASALQLRSGYPPPASYSNGMGRHTFVFMRSISAPASLAFHAFTAVPFLYEMRQLLDWSCTPTTLTYVRYIYCSELIIKKKEKGFRVYMLLYICI